MAAAHTGILTHEGKDTIIRIPASLSLPDGPILVRESGRSGTDLTLQTSHPPVFANLDEFITYRDSLPRDASWNTFMIERPGNEVSTPLLPFQNEEAIG